MTRKQGAIIGVESIDGGGKTTLCHRIVDHIRALGKEAVYTSAISAECTEVGSFLGNYMKDPRNHILHDVECAMMIAARVDNYQRVIEPALNAGKVVVSDRFLTSLLVYQRGKDGERINPLLAKQRLQAFGLGTHADLTIFLDLDPRKAHHDMDREHNRLEDRPIEEWDDFRLAFQNQYLYTPSAIMIDAEQSKSAVFARARPEVESLLDRMRSPGWRPRK